jgi:thioredoxin reductase (NADPH)
VISSTTPDKLAEIIRDTWPGLYRIPQVSYNKQNTKTNEKLVMDADNLITLFGLSPKLGPMESWGLNIEKNAIVVNTDDYSTNIEGVYAIGDINTYKNKLKLILCGFHESALMSHSAYKYINPGIKYTMKYTTVNGVNEF